jgi:hypothetical protein
MPPNLQEVKLKFARRRSAKVMGTLADREIEPQEGEEVKGILVTHNFHSKIVAPEDLQTYTPLRIGSIRSKLHVPFIGSKETLKLFLSEMYACVTITDGGEGQDGASITTFGLHGDQVKVTLGRNKGVATVSWQASPVGDVIADSVVALLMHAQSSSASIRLTSKPCRHPRDSSSIDEQTQKKNRSGDDVGVEERLRFLYSTLKDQFQNVEATYEAYCGKFEITTDSGLEPDVLNEDGKLICVVTVSFDDKSANGAEISVECKDEKLAANVQSCLRNVVTATIPLST